MADQEELWEKYRNILSTKLPENLRQLKKQDVTLTEIKQIVDHIQDFLGTIPEDSCCSLVLCRLVELITELGLVHKFGKEDRDFSKEDFPDVPENAVKCVQDLEVLLDKFLLLEHGHKRHSIINILLLCATHNESYFWSNDRSISSCKELLQKILAYTNCPDVSSLLCDESFHPTLFKGVLKKLRPSLLKDSWMNNPSSCYVFFWFLSHVKHPILVDYLPDVFPPPFMFVSYHGVPQKVLGIKCFSHLLDNVPPTLIKLDGKEDAIYHSLHYLTYDKNLLVTEVLFPCILKLPMMRAQNVSFLPWSEFDNLFNRLLISLEMERNLEVRRSFLLHTLTFVERRPPFKHLKLLKSILKRNLVTCLFSDKNSQETALKILKSVIKSCWPRMEHHCFDILVLVLELFDQNVFDANDVRRRLSEECLVLLNQACSEKFKLLTKNYIEDPSLPGAVILKQINLEKNSDTFDLQHV